MISVVCCCCCKDVSAAGVVHAELRTDVVQYVVVWICMDCWIFGAPCESISQSAVVPESRGFMIALLLKRSSASCAWSNPRMIALAVRSLSQLSMFHKRLHINTCEGWRTEFHGSKSAFVEPFSRAATIYFEVYCCLTPISARCFGLVG